ncbi:hypothetical protein ACHAWF_009467 [Thalassiosira exigua]
MNRIAADAAAAPRYEIGGPLTAAQPQRWHAADVHGPQDEGEGPQLRPRRRPGGGDGTSGRTPGRSWQVFLGVLIALVAFNCVRFHSAMSIRRSHDDVGGIDKRSLPKLGRRPGSSERYERRLWAGGNIGVVCPSALELFEDYSELKAVILANVHFHQRGGNLRTIERYLNSHMQHTLHVLGMEFIPDGADPPTRDSISYLNEHYRNHKVLKGGYGQPLPGNFVSKYGNELRDRALFQKRWINVIEPIGHERYPAGMGPVGPACANKVSFSKGTHDEKNLCIPAKRGAGTEEECNIISIGSNDEWGFEIEYRRKLPSCKTHTFDCTLRNNLPRKKPRDENVKFYPYCIGSEDARPPYLPYNILLNATGTKVPPKLLKMDVEGFECDVLDALLSSDDPSSLPEQIALEVHWATRMVDVPWMLRTRTAAEIALFFGGLFNRGGYVISHVRSFPMNPTCLELLLVRAVCPPKGALPVSVDVPKEQWVDNGDYYP